MAFCNADPLFYGCEIKGESNKMRNVTISGRIVRRSAVVGFMTKNSGMIQSGQFFSLLHSRYSPHP